MDEEIKFDPSTRLSFLGVEPGLRSKDGVVIVGYDGFLFIAGGTNNVIDQYKATDTAKIDRTANAWLSLMEKRQASLDRQGVKYIQVIIPEKSSVVPEYFPSDDVATETPLLKSVEARVDPRIHPFYAGALDAMRNFPQRSKLIRHLDSHLTPAGAYCIFQTILKSLGEQVHSHISFDDTVLLGSDLGVKLCDLPFREQVAFPQASQFAACETGLKRTKMDVPADGQHLGTNVVWQNSSSILDLRVVAFANSFFERGMSPCNLTWWSARWFREFHFVWSPRIDYEYLNVVKPDICVCQTVERFLHMVPPL